MGTVVMVGHGPHSFPTGIVFWDWLQELQECLPVQAALFTKLLMGLALVFSTQEGKPWGG